MAVLVSLLVCGAVDRPVLAQPTAELKPLDRDEADQGDRSGVLLRSDATLWDLATTSLPLAGLQKGTEQADSRRGAGI